MEAPSIESLKLDTLEIVAAPHFEKTAIRMAEWSYLRRRARVYWYEPQSKKSCAGLARSCSFARTASEKYVLGGQKIKTGDSLILYCPSANRDEDVFNEPFRFDIRRDPNAHLALGVGEHFCLGANLARLELEVIFRALLKNVEYVESTGPLERCVLTLLEHQAHAGADEASSAFGVLESIARTPRAVPLRENLKVLDRQGESADAHRHDDWRGSR